jgi:hypothetical protein
MAVIIKIPTRICVGLIMGEKRNGRGKTCHIFEHPEIFQSNFFFSDKAA